MTGPSDRVRAMLDGRGVGYRADDHGGFRTTSWLARGVQWNFIELDGETVLSMNRGWRGATPEQAVSATLGAGELTAEQVRGAVFDGSAYAGYDGARYYADGIDMQAIADVLNAALGSGTCEEVEVEEFFRGCSNCGYMWEYMYGVGDRVGPGFCPRCGAKVRKAVGA